MNNWGRDTLNADGKSYGVHYLVRDGVCWVSYLGRTWQFKSVSHSFGGDEEAGEGAVLAPMTGKVLRIEVEIGQRVVADDVLIVLEAMKMEYRLKAPFNGVVERLSVVEGEQVEQNTLVVVVAEAQTTTAADKGEGDA